MSVPCSHLHLLPHIGKIFYTALFFPYLPTQPQQDACTLLALLDQMLRGGHVGQLKESLGVEEVVLRGRGGEDGTGSE